MLFRYYNGERLSIFNLSIDHRFSLQYNGSCIDVKLCRKGVFFMITIVFRHRTNIIFKVVQV